MMRHRPLPLLAILAFLFAAPARAWDPDIHLALLRAAMGISPAAEARVPLEHRDAIFKEAQSPDFYDKDCRYHCSTAEPKDPAAEAEKLLDALLNPKGPLRPYTRAQMVGRYIHYVGDSVSPMVIRRGMAPKLPNFFANQDFIFYREPRALALPVGAALRARGLEVEWPNSGSITSYPYIFRLAANTMADALMLLPPREDAAQAADTGPVHFLVNRIDSGLAGKRTYAGWEKTGHTYSNSGPSWYGHVDTSGGYDVWTWNPGSKGGGQSFYKPNLMERKGVQLAEMIARQEATSVTLRAILFNNSELCAENVHFKAGDWTWRLPETMAPGALRVITVQAPADVLSRNFQNKGTPVQCSQASAVRIGLDTTRARIYGNSGTTPRFDSGLTEYDITHDSAKAKKPKSNFSPNTRY